MGCRLSVLSSSAARIEPREIAPSTSAKKTPKTLATISLATERCRAVIASTSTTRVPPPLTTSSKKPSSGECTKISTKGGTQYTAMPRVITAPRRGMAASWFTTKAARMPPTPSAASR